MADDKGLSADGGYKKDRIYEKLILRRRVRDSRSDGSEQWIGLVMAVSTSMIYRVIC